MKKDPEEVYDRLKKDTSTYLELKLELLKLNTYERAGKLISLLSYGLVLMFLAFFACLFVFIALDFFVGEYLGDTALGFLLVAAIYLLLIALIAFNGACIREKIMNIIIASLLANDIKKDESSEQQVDTTPGADL